MLKALLHRKLGRVVVGVAEGDGDAEDTASDGLTEREDPLTSTVFERLAYLPPDVVWEILRRASKPVGDGPRLPAAPPRGAPSWLFWPRLRPGELGLNKRRVEPDVVVSWGDTVILIEAKHRGLQDPVQWVEQIRAVREAPAHAGKQVWLFAVGGIVLHESSGYFDQVRGELGDDLPGLLEMRWEDLREVLHSLDELTSSSGHAEIVHDIAAGLEAWGYRRKTSFSSLADVAARLRIKTAPSALQDWRNR